MSANLIISLDCEGKWGLSNQPKLIKEFTNQNLIKTYKKINYLFNKLSIPVTYAFVGSFILNNEEKKNFDCFDSLDNCYSAPLVNFFNDDEQNKKEGWFLPEIYELVNNELNEIASHSFSHLLFNEKLNNNIIEKELNNCNLVAKLKKKKFETFIFPYNKISNLESIKKYGFKGYRNHKDYKRNFNHRVKNLLNEWNIWGNFSEHLNNLHDDLIQIPGGEFFNWRFKMRKYLIPKNITIMKWKNYLNQAVKFNKTLNLWFHPHNILSAPSTYDVLKEIVYEAYKMRENGKLNIITQKNYVDLTLANKRNLKSN